MTITQKRDLDNNTVHLKIEGKIDSLQGDKFISAIMSSAGQYSNLVLDMSDTVYISSAGIRGLVLGSKACASRGGTLVISSASDTVTNVLKAVGLDKSIRGTVLGD